MGFVSKIIKTTLMNIFDPGNGMSEGMDDLDEDMDEMDDEMDDETDDETDDDDTDDDDTDETDNDEDDDADDADDADLDDDGGMVISTSMNRGASVSFGGYTPGQCAKISTGTQNYCPMAGAGR